MKEKEIAEAILTGQEPNIEEAEIHVYYTENLNRVVDELQDKEFAIPAIICGLTGEVCRNNGKCSVCEIALESLTKASLNMEEAETDLIKFSTKYDTKNGIEYMTTPSGVIQRFQNKSQMLAHFDWDGGSLVEMNKEDVRDIINESPSVYAGVLGYILEQSEKVYVIENRLVFEREGGSLIVYSPM